MQKDTKNMVLKINKHKKANLPHIDLNKITKKKYILKRKTDGEYIKVNENDIKDIPYPINNNEVLTISKDEIISIIKKNFDIYRLIQDYFQRRVFYMENILVNGKKEMISIAKNIIDNDYHVIDNHTKEQIEYKPTGLVLTENGEVGMLLDTDTFCINKCYINKKDNLVHLSKIGLCGTVFGKFNMEDFNKNNGGNIVEVIWLKNVFTKRFENVEEFDKMFMNPDSIFIL